MERLRAQRKAQVEADAVEAQKAMKGHATFNIGPSDELVARAERPGEPTDGSAAKHDEVTPPWRLDLADSQEELNDSAPPAIEVVVPRGDKYSAPGDWICSACNSLNFKRRTRCNSRRCGKIRDEHDFIYGSSSSSSSSSSGSARSAPGHYGRASEALSSSSSSSSMGAEDQFDRPTSGSRIIRVTGFPNDEKGGASQSLERRIVEVLAPHGSQGLFCSRVKPSYAQRFGEQLKVPREFTSVSSFLRSIDGVEEVNRKRQLGRRGDELLFVVSSVALARHRAQKLAEADSSTPLLSALQDGEWQCPVCSFVNQNRQTRCARCFRGSRQDKHGSVAYIFKVSGWCRRDLPEDWPASWSPDELSANVIADIISQRYRFKGDKKVTPSMVKFDSEKSYCLLSLPSEELANAVNDGISKGARPHLYPQANQRVSIELNVALSVNQTTYRISGWTNEQFPPRSWNWDSRRIPIPKLLQCLHYKFIPPALWSQLGVRIGDHTRYNRRKELGNRDAEVEPSRNHSCAWLVVQKEADIRRIDEYIESGRKFYLSKPGTHRSSSRVLLHIQKEVYPSSEKVEATTSSSSNRSSSSSTTTTSGISKGGHYGPLCTTTTTSATCGMSDDDASDMQKEAHNHQPFDPAKCDSSSSSSGGGDGGGGGTSSSSSSSSSSSAGISMLDDDESDLEETQPTLDDDDDDDDDDGDDDDDDGDNAENENNEEEEGYDMMVQDSASKNDPNEVSSTSDTDREARFRDFGSFEDRRRSLFSIQTAAHRILKNKDSYTFRVDRDDVLGSVLRAVKTTSKRDDEALKYDLLKVSN
jgi:hypothetical protein